PAPRLFAHEAPGLGVVAVSVAQPRPDGAPRMLAHGYPLQPQALRPLLQQLAAQYGTAAELDTRGQVVLDAAGALGAPRSEEHTSELQSRSDLVCRLLLEKKKKTIIHIPTSIKKQIKNII